MLGLPTPSGLASQNPDVGVNLRISRASASVLTKLHFGSSTAHLVRNHGPMFIALARSAKRPRKLVWAAIDPPRGERQEKGRARSNVNSFAFKLINLQRAQAGAISIGPQHYSIDESILFASLAALMPLSQAPCAVEKSEVWVASPAKSSRSATGRASILRESDCPGKAWL